MQIERTRSETLTGIAFAQRTAREWLRQQYRRTAIGAGATTCEVFIRRAGSDGLSDPASLQWVLGYLSGHVAALDKPHRPFTAPEGIARALIAYCQAHPAHQLDAAEASFFERNRRCSAAHRCR